MKRTIKIPHAVRPMQNNRVSSALCPSSAEIRCRVVEGGCRFGKIDAVLRNVRFFLVSHSNLNRHILAPYGIISIYNCNIIFWLTMWWGAHAPSRVVACPERSRRNALAERLCIAARLRLPKSPPGSTRRWRVGFLCQPKRLK